MKLPGDLQVFYEICTNAEELFYCGAKNRHLYHDDENSILKLEAVFRLVVRLFNYTCYKSFKME